MLCQINYYHTIHLHCISHTSIEYYTQYYYYIIQASCASLIHDAIVSCCSHVYIRLSVMSYQSVIPNSHQVPCNGFMLVAASQPAMQPNTDTHYQSFSVRFPYSSHAIVSSTEMSTKMSTEMSAVILACTPPCINSRHVRSATYSKYQMSDIVILLCQSRSNTTV